MESSPSTSFVARNTRAHKRCAGNTINQSEEQKRMKLEDDHKNCKEERYFNRLLQMVLDCVISLKQIPENDITQSISSIICTFQRGSEQFSYVNLKKWENLCAYLFRYGLHGAILTRIKVLEAIENCPALQSVLKKRSLRVITLGGGPGNDSIGICSALQDYHTRSQININVTVVDAVREWSLCVNLVKSFIPEGEFGNISELFNSNNVDLSFLNVQLPGNRRLDKKYFQKLEKADIILMTKLISSLEWHDKKNIITVNTFFNLYYISK